MAKGGSQRRRIQQKKQEERLRRKRKERNKKLTRFFVALTVIALIAGFAFAFVANNDNTPLVKASATPTPTTCTTPGPETAGKKTFSAPPCMTIDTTKTYTATIKTTKGTMKVRLLAAEAPQTVNSFVFLARQKYFNGLTFHRVIPQFGKSAGNPKTDMIQGGDPEGTGGGGPGYQFANENPAAFDKPGLLAMANAGADTNGSQFFVLNGPWKGGNPPGTCPAPQGCYTVFGEVVSGLKAVHTIATVPTTNEKPKKDVVLIKVTIQEN